MRYRSAVAGARAYENISYFGLGVIGSLVKHYAGQSWQPDDVTLDFVEHRRRDRIEETLGSREHFGGEHVCIFVPDEILDLPNPHPTTGWNLTIGDVYRARRGRSPLTPSEDVIAIVRMQMLEGVPDLDQVAQMLAIGTRTLQRRLDEDGTSFRRIVEAVVFKRADELLGEPDNSIARIATSMGYSSPSHFARAFRRASGRSRTANRNVLHSRSADQATSKTGDALRISNVRKFRS